MHAAGAKSDIRLELTGAGRSEAMSTMTIERPCRLSATH
jgi:hypothetical protein